jgi:hypothetical protein
MHHGFALPLPVGGKSGSDTFRWEIRFMKKLLILTAVLMLAGSAVGCHWCDWLWRGSYSNPNPCPPTPVYSNPCYNPCPPAPCDPCAGAPVAPVMTVVPGPAQ